MQGADLSAPSFFYLPFSLFPLNTQYEYKIIEKCYIFWYIKHKLNTYLVSRESYLVKRIEVNSQNSGARSQNKKENNSRFRLLDSGFYIIYVGADLVSAHDNQKTANKEGHDALCPYT